MGSNKTSKEAETTFLKNEDSLSKSKILLPSLTSSTGVLFSVKEDNLYNSNKEIKNETVWCKRTHHIQSLASILSFSASGLAGRQLDPIHL